MQHAYPEDELRPLTCQPLTRDRANPSHIEVNDVLGNYSLSLVDSLSTLAILASTPKSNGDDHDALLDFQRHVAMLVSEYGDGSAGEKGQGRRARGFDLDSKVQVFETTIRGLGGLLSAHLFAMGDLPIRGYEPEWHLNEQEEDMDGIWWHDINQSTDEEKTKGVFVYNGQLLRLAEDLGKRLLPAFHTPTGMPYPRVNLRYGVPFYQNSPLNNDAEEGQCLANDYSAGQKEVTETCSAGAGSLTLEFTVLSRLTGVPIYEDLAHKAFRAVWERRTNLDLLGSGIDAETGQWVFPYTGIGAGIDSFFEYAFKTHILLSGFGNEDSENSSTTSLSSEYLHIWEMAHEAVSRHVYRGVEYKHPHYLQNDMWNGGVRFHWIDSLSAFYPGLLTLAGHVEEATATHLFYTALWTKYGALPERWNVKTGLIDSGLSWWGGRPEFIESTWYLYQATKDPFYLHVGKMVMNDIQKRCWTPCGWAGLQDVRTGEKTDRMESFFLGETAKYMYLLFDPDHPLNHMDAPIVFTTEGHPLIIPRDHTSEDVNINAHAVMPSNVCPASPRATSMSGSTITNRKDFFHAAILAQLVEQRSIPSTGQMHEPRDDAQDKAIYPSHLPASLLPHDGVCAKLAIPRTLDLTFPSLPSSFNDFTGLQRTDRGILIKSVSNLRLTLLMDSDSQFYKIVSLAGVALGRDEQLWLSPEVFTQINPTDPNLYRTKNMDTVDLYIDAHVETNPSLTPQTHVPANVDYTTHLSNLFTTNASFVEEISNAQSPVEALFSVLPDILLSDPMKLADHLEEFAQIQLPNNGMNQILRNASKDLREGRVPSQSTSSTPLSNVNLTASTNQPIKQFQRFVARAMLPTGPGAAPLPFKLDDAPQVADLPFGGLPYRDVLLLESTLCDFPLPSWIPRRFTVLVIRRGQCSFSTKLSNIPAYPPTVNSLALIIVVTFSDVQKSGENGEAFDPDLIKPFLHEHQMTPGGQERRNPIAMIMTGTGDELWKALKNAACAIGTVEEGGKVNVVDHKGIKVTGRDRDRDGMNGSDEKRINDHDILTGGIGIKRRYWFSNNGFRIANLHAA